MSKTNTITEHVQICLLEARRLRNAKIAGELKAHTSVLRGLEEETIIALFEKCISLRQQHIQNHGCNLEGIVKDILTTHSINFEEQVEIDKNGIIIGFGSKTKKCYHVVDFVIGDVQLQTSISNYKVLSCKTTCRERWTQDNWSLTLKPFQYILITTSDDYPPSSRFQESECRKIITLKKKKKDDRIYKLSFDNLIKELSSLNTIEE